MAIAVHQGYRGMETAHTLGPRHFVDRSNWWRHWEENSSVPIAISVMAGLIYVSWIPPNGDINGGNTDALTYNSLPPSKGVSPPYGSGASPSPHHDNNSNHGNSMSSHTSQQSNTNASSSRHQQTRITPMTPTRGVYRPRATSSSSNGGSHHDGYQDDKDDSVTSALISSDSAALIDDSQQSGFHH
jgi:hypothetical protein